MTQATKSPDSSNLLRNEYVSHLKSVTMWVTPNGNRHDSQTEAVMALVEADLQSYANEVDMSDIDDALRWMEAHADLIALYRRLEAEAGEMTHQPKAPSVSLTSDCGKWKIEIDETGVSILDEHSRDRLCFETIGEVINLHALSINAIKVYLQGALK